MEALVRIFREHQARRTNASAPPAAAPLVWRHSLSRRSFSVAVRPSRISRCRNCRSRFPATARDTSRDRRRSDTEIPRANRRRKDNARSLPARRSPAKPGAATADRSARARSESPPLILFQRSDHFAPELFVRARALYLIEHELFVLLHRFDDCSQFAHFFFRSGLLSADSALTIRFGGRMRRATESRLIISYNSSTPASRWRFATVATICCSRLFCVRRCSISESAAFAPVEIGLVHDHDVGHIEHHDLLQLQTRAVIRIHHQDRLIDQSCCETAALPARCRPSR